MALDIATHKNIMLQILKDIYSDGEIAPHLGFKGGTAAYLFYGLDRFSVDLDFDLLDESKEDLVFKKAAEIIKGYGETKDSAKKRFTLFFLLSYQKGAQGVKIEINRRFLGSRFELKTYLGISMMVMSKEDMAANKLLAMRDRMGRANRDIFDVWFFLKNNWPVNREIVEKRSGQNFSEFLKACVTGLEKMESRDILAGLGELLDNKQKAWAKEKLINDTIFLLKLKMEENNPTPESGASRSSRIALPRNR